MDPPFPGLPSIIEQPKHGLRRPADRGPTAPNQDGAFQENRRRSHRGKKLVGRGR
jgi:hypothetical protein